MNRSLMMFIFFILSSSLIVHGQQLLDDNIEYRFSTIEKGTEIANLYTNKTTNTLAFNKIVSTDTVIAFRIIIQTNNTGKFSATVRGSIENSDVSQWSLFKRMRILANEQLIPKVFIFHTSKLGFNSNFGNISIGVEFNVLNGGVGILHSQIKLEYEIGTYSVSHERNSIGESNQTVLSILQLPFTRTNFSGSVFLFSKFAEFLIQIPDILTSNKLDIEITVTYMVEDSNSFSLAPYFPVLKAPDKSQSRSNFTTFFWNGISLDQDLKISFEARNSPATVSLTSIRISPSIETEGFLDKLLVVRGNSPVFGIFVVAIVWGSYLGVTKRRISLGAMRMNN